MNNKEQLATAALKNSGSVAADKIIDKGNAAPATTEQTPTAPKTTIKKQKPAEQKSILPTAQDREAEPKRETKSQRVQLMMKPSLVAAIDRAAEQEGYSRNDYINRLLENAMRNAGKL